MCVCVCVCVCVSERERKRERESIFFRTCDGVMMLPHPYSATQRRHTAQCRATVVRSACVCSGCHEQLAVAQKVLPGADVACDKQQINGIR